MAAPAVLSLRLKNSTPSSGPLTADPDGSDEFLNCSVYHAEMIINGDKGQGLVPVSHFLCSCSMDTASDHGLNAMSKSATLTGGEGKEGQHV